MDDQALRYQIYRHFADHGTGPDSSLIGDWVGGADAAESALRRLHNAHSIVLDPAGQIRMALPFSAVETRHRVVSGDRIWWANCAWDTLAIPAALDIDATIEADWLDIGEPIDLEIRRSELFHGGGFIHLVIPARHWWDDIVET